MTAIKRTYVKLVQSTARLDRRGNLIAWGSSGRPYGWRRWAVSLLAIYDTQRMVALDLPWWNVAATREVESFLRERPLARVFEFGAGASTAWLARRAGEVASVEHDAAFIGHFRALLRPFANVTLMERSIENPSDYIDAIDDAGGPFDLIVVDGRHRRACLEAALRHLKSDGIVLFDDSGRKRYRGGIGHCGLVETHYYGRSFCVPYPDHTSILSRGG